MHKIITIMMKGCVDFRLQYCVNLMNSLKWHDVMTLISLEKVTALLVSQANPLNSNLGLSDLLTFLWKSKAKQYRHLSKLTQVDSSLCHHKWRVRCHSFTTLWPRMLFLNLPDCIRRINLSSLVGNVTQISCMTGEYDKSSGAACKSWCKYCSTTFVKCGL